MKYWYKRDKNGRWIFCYSLNKEEQEVVDKVMPNAVRVFKGLPIKEAENE